MQRGTTSWACYSHEAYGFGGGDRGLAALFDSEIELNLEGQIVGGDDSELLAVVARVSEHYPALSEKPKRSDDDILTDNSVVCARLDIRDSDRNKAVEDGEVRGDGILCGRCVSRGQHHR